MLSNIHYDQRYVSLLEVYHFKNFASAARSLSLTASAVAQQIRSVERELDTPLFRRGEKRLIPTKECEQLVTYIEKIQLICRRMSDDVKTVKCRTKHLTVGVTPTAENFALAGMLENLSDRFTQVTVKTGSADQLCELIKNYSIDLAVIEGNVSSDGLNEVILDTDQLVVAVPSDSNYTQKGMISPEELFHEPLIMKPAGSGTRTLFDASLQSAGVISDRMRVILEAENTDTLIKLVANGYGLSVLSQKACADAVKQGKIVTIPLSGVPMMRSIRIIYPKDHDLNEVIGEIQRCYIKSLHAVDTAKKTEKRHLQ